MRLPKRSHLALPWRIHEVTHGFHLEDVWQLPTPGGRDDFGRLVALMTSLDPSRDSGLARLAFAIRWKLGAVLGWDETPGATASLRDRLPADLLDGPTGPGFATLPFTPLYLTDNEYAAEIINRTVHAVMHLSWVEDQAGNFHGEMAVYVRRNGLLGLAYMAAIQPFRLIGYPSMLRSLGQRWKRATAASTTNS